MQRRFISGLGSLIFATTAILGLTTVRPATAGPPIGINVGWTNDYSPDLMFADAMTMARFWQNMTGTNYNIGDANGWPTVDAECGLWFGATIPLNGTYALSFTGQAATIYFTVGTATISNQVYDSGTNTPWRVVNIGNSDKVKLLDFVDAIEEATGRRAQRIYLPMQPGDVPATWADASLLRSLTGYAPQTDVKDGIAAFVSWYREYYGV